MNEALSEEEVKDTEGGLLNFAANSDSIITAFIRGESCMRNYTLSLLDKHTYRIWQYKDGRWYAKLPDSKKRETGL